MDIPPEFAEALLKSGNYYTPKLANIKTKEAMLVRMGGTAITNDTSTIPVIGTAGLDPCYALILYNTKTKTAILSHQPWPDDKLFHSLLNRIRANADDNVLVHIIGGSIVTERDDDNYENMNQMNVDSLTRLLETITKTDNTTLKTFDVFNKPKTHAVAIDARSGDLIRGTKLYKNHGQRDSLRDHFDKWNFMENMKEDFDGTVPELQRQRHHD